MKVCRLLIFRHISDMLTLKNTSHHSDIETRVMRKALLSVPQLNARNLIMTSGKLALPDLRAHVHVWKYMQIIYFLF